MRKLLLSLVICLYAVAGNAQATLETVNMYVDDVAYQIIQPTINNLISLVNMDVSTFKSTMAKYRYHADEQEAGTSYVYTNMNIDFFLYDDKGKGSNTIVFDPYAGKNRFAGIIVYNGQTYPSNCIQDMYQQLAPYYLKSENGTRYYGLSSYGRNYVIEARPIKGYAGTVVHIYRCR